MSGGLGYGASEIADQADSGALTVVGTILVDTLTISFTALTGTLLCFDLRARNGDPVAGPGPDRSS